MNAVANVKRTYSETKEEFVDQIVNGQYQIDPAVTAIYRIKSLTEDDQLDPLKLLLVDEDAVPTGIVPVFVGNSNWYINKITDSDKLLAVPVPVVLVDITPNEYNYLKTGQLELPDGWLLDDNPFPRPNLTD